MRLPRHDVLFEPLQIGSKVFRNRFYSVPHAAFPIGRRLSDVGFRRTKAEGGWAAVCGGVISIRPDSWSGFVPRLWDDVDRAVLARTAREVRSQGALAGIELGHAGGLGAGEKFAPAFGVSQVPDLERGRFLPKEADLGEIRELLDDWIDAANRAAELGYDIVYAYGGHGMLPAQFLSPHFNRRTDAYGGPLENRARFWLELLEGMRSRIGDRCLIAGRIAAETFSAAGVSAAETLRFIEMADEFVDLWDVNVGHSWPADSAPWRAEPEGYQLQWSGKVRSVTTRPIVGVGRVTTPDAMVDILRSGVWDFIGAARPGIADPFLPRKIEEGRYEDLRECTGGNFCIAMETTGIGLSCVQNPTIGEEYRRGWHPERFAPLPDRDIRVLIVGAGPAGMECARVLGERGATSVHLVDSGGEIGGHLRWLRRVPGHGGLGRAADYRITQLGRLEHVVVATSRELNADHVLAYGADVVVIASGSRWVGVDTALGWPPLEQITGGPAILTPEDVMVHDVRPTGSTVIWDGHGGGVAAGVAELLAVEGHLPGFATPFDRVAPALDATFEGGPCRSRLHDLGIEPRTGVTPVRFTGGGLVLRNGWGEESTVDCEALVLVAHRVSDDGLYRDLRGNESQWGEAGIRHVWRVGDCVAPRALGLVIADGHRLGREIEHERAGTPVPPTQERDEDASVAAFG